MRTVMQLRPITHLGRKAHIGNTMTLQLILAPADFSLEPFNFLAFKWGALRCCKKVK